MIPQPSRDIAGSRLYRTTLAIVLGNRTAEDELRRIRARLTAAAYPPRLAAVDTPCRQPGWLELELQMRSSEADDEHDIDAVAEMRVGGARAASFWTRPAATLLDATITGAEIVREAIGLQPREEVLDALVMRTAPLGEESRRADASVLEAPPRGVPVIHVQGVPARYGEQLVALIRDEIDEQRWGPVCDQLPVVRYAPSLRSIVVRYPTVDPEHRHASRIFDALGDLAAALEHLKQVLDQIGAVGGSCVEARIDPAVTPAEPGQPRVGS